MLCLSSGHRARRGTHDLGNAGQHLGVEGVSLGTRWRIVASPCGPFSTIAALAAVAAIARRNAWAVGDVLYETVAAHWNGVRWGIAPTPNTNV